MGKESALHQQPMAQRAGLLPGVYILISIIVVAFASLLHYRTSLNNARLRLEELIEYQAEFAAAVARHDVHEQGSIEQGRQATIDRLADVHAERDASHAAALLFAWREDAALFVVGSSPATGPLPMQEVPPEGPRRQAIERALAGENGSVLADDRSGATILIAFRYLPELDVAVLSELPVAALRSPALQAAAWAIAIALLGTLIPVALFVRHDRRLWLRIQRREIDLAEAQHTAHLGSWRWDIDSGNITWSDESYRIFGFEPNQLNPTFDAFLAAVHPEDRDAVQKAVKAALLEGVDYRIEHRVVRPDGEQRIVEERAEVQLDAAGLPYQMTGTVLDVTEYSLARQALAHERNLAATFLDNANALVLVLARDGSIVRFNRACELVSGYRSAEVIGRKPWELLMQPASASGFKRFCTELFTTGIAGEHACEWLSRDGELHKIVWASNAIRGASAELSFIVAVGTDVTEAKRAEQRLSLAARVFEHTAEGILITDGNAKIIEVNDAYCHITGYQRHEVLGRNFGMMRSARHDDSFYREMWRTLHKEGLWRGEVWDERKDGQTYPKLLSLSRVQDEQGQTSYYVGVFSDITARKQVEERLEKLAHNDPLTSLPNRRLFLDTLSRALNSDTRHNRKLAVLFVDLDRFKQINDTLGHEIGDAMLTQVAQRLSSCMRGEDMAARIGGDEFAVVMPEVRDLRDAEELAERMLQRLAAPVTIEGHNLHIRASIGIALFPDNGTDTTALLRCADIAMYRAKETGRGRCVAFSQALSPAAAKLTGIKHDLSRAFDNRQLELFYQPVFELGSGRLVGAEALLRWFHPVRGYIAPALFVPVAEESGLIISIGRWVMEHACVQARLWSEKLGPGFSIAINLSARQLRQSTLCEDFRAQLESNKLAPGSIEVEINQGTLMENLEQNIEVLSQLREVGLRIAIDDLGFGDLGFGYRHPLPIDSLKVAQPLTGELSLGWPGQNHLASIVSMAHWRGLMVIAEGIETTEQLQLLQQQGADRAQGFLLGRPVASSDFVAQIADGMLRAGMQNKH